MILRFAYRIIFIISFLSLSILTFAQNETLFIDASSFTEVNINAITGLNIDKVGLDRSNRPCARLKIHMNRMTRDEIGNVELRAIGGNVIVMKRIVATEGNGLIVELTAKPEVRFYLHHPKFGDSNPVTVNLEANKEYRLEAFCSQKYSINIMTKYPGIDVYLDETYMGKTSSDNIVTIKDVLPGQHTIKIDNSGEITIKDIFVTSEQILFKISSPDKHKLSNYLIFHIQPSNSILEVNGQTYSSRDGIVEVFLESGEYHFHVFSEEYYPYDGAIAFDAKNKKEVNVNLKPAFGFLTIDAPELAEAQVFVDESFIGYTPIIKYKISDKIHNIRIAKEKYKSFESEIYINSGENNSPKIKLNANFGTLSVKSGNVQNAKVYVDNHFVGTTPLYDLKLSEGIHDLRIQEPLYKVFKSKVDIKIGNTYNFNENLEAIYKDITLITVNQYDEIWINGKLKSKGFWKGPLKYGIYMIEIKKTSHKTYSQKLEVSADMLNTTLKFKELSPLYGSLRLTSTPSNSDTYLDGRYLGKTPLYISDVLTGQHQLTIKTDKKRIIESIEILENQINTHHATLKDIPHIKNNNSSTKIEGNTFKRKNYDTEYDTERKLTFGTGIDLILSSTFMGFTIPCDLLVGRMSQTFNFLLSGSYSYLKQVGGGIFLSQLGILPALQINIGHNDYLCFPLILSLGYNFNLKRSSHLMSGYYTDYDTFEDHYLSFPINVNNGCLYSIFSLGMRFRHFYFSLYGRFDWTPALDKSLVSIPTDDYIFWDEYYMDELIKSSRYIPLFGISLKWYF